MKPVEETIDVPDKEKFWAHNLSTTPSRLAVEVVRSIAKLHDLYGGVR